VREQFRVIETADLALAEANVTPDYLNRRAGQEPLAARSRGPRALHATATWLRAAFSELQFVVDDFGAVGDKAVAWVTLHGVHTGPYVLHDSPDVTVTGVFPPTGRAFAVRQVHWFRIVNAPPAGRPQIAEHDAVRDDLGMAKQVGWIPPSPAYVARMRLALRRARRATTSG
jgi:hypothetical protein